MKPIIGVIANTGLNQFNMPATTIPLAYTSSIEKSGGVPVILPFTRDNNILASMVDSVKGLLFPGGNDIDPKVYHELRAARLGEVDRELDLFQMSALKLAMARKKPLLAICRGIQLVNVTLGGTLFQDIPSQFDTLSLEKHMQSTISFDTDHSVNFEPGSTLHGLFGDCTMINSRHHQSVKTPGKDLVVTARAPDGVIEGLQHKDLPMFLVQWHPELMMQKDDAMLPLFSSFVQRCQTQ